jgi:hypothetical protein
MGPQPSVPYHRYVLPIWARRPRTAVILPALLLVLWSPSVARADNGGAPAGTGGVPGPDPSTQFAPDPAPSARQQASTPPASAPARATAPATVAPTTVVATPQSRSHRRHTGAKHRRAHRAHPARHISRPASARPLPALFVSSLDVALHVPVPPAGASAHSPGDALVLAAIALLLLVFTGLMVVRTSAQVLRRERPA